MEDWQIRTKFQLFDLKERDHLQDLEKDEIILSFVLKTYGRRIKLWTELKKKTTVMKLRAPRNEVNS